MAAVTQEKQYTPSLLSFFVYNPSFGPREGEVSAHLTCVCVCYLNPNLKHAQVFNCSGSVYASVCLGISGMLNHSCAQEEKKILFYHPSEVEKNEKIRNVGLCEAIVQFTR